MRFYMYATPARKPRNDEKVLPSLFLLELGMSPSLYPLKQVVFMYLDAVAGEVAGINPDKLRSRSPTVVRWNEVGLRVVQESPAEPT